MSADNHVACPRCKKRGNDPDPSNPLREYINVGMRENGVLMVHYLCQCSFCDFNWGFVQRVVVSDDKLR